MKNWFSFKHIKGDLFGGLTAGIVALPLALAFGLQSGLGAAAGLYGAIFISFFAALFGGTNTQISGPTAPMTAVSMVIIAGIIGSNEGDLERALPIILFVFLLAGLIQIALGFARLGEYVKYIPYPVVSGFMTGIGIIILATQILPLIGYYPAEDTHYVDRFIPEAEEVLMERILLEEAAEGILVLEDFEETVRRSALITPEEIQQEARVLAKKDAGGVVGSMKILPRGLGFLDWTTFLLGLLTIGIIYGFRQITRAVPSTLVALLVVSLIAIFFIEDYRTIGNIPSGFPKFHLNIVGQFSWEQISPYLFTAVSLALLGAIDSLLTSIVADNLTKTRHKPNQELIGQGIGNSIAAFFGGIPGAGATIRTVVNIHAGGKTRLSGMFAGILLLVILLALGPVASKIPAAVLAGILITVGIGVMDYRGLRDILKAPRAEALTMLVVISLTVMVGLIEAVGVGLVLACLFFMKIIADMSENKSHSQALQDLTPEQKWKDEEKLLPKSIEEKIIIKHLDGPLFFGFASALQDQLQALPNMKMLVIRMDKVPYLDQSGLYALEDTIRDLQEQNVLVGIVGLHGQPRELFYRFELIPSVISEDFLYEEFQDFVKWAEA